MEAPYSREGASGEEALAYRVEASDLGDPWETQTEALGAACPWEEVRGEAFQEAAGEVAVPQSLVGQHGDVLSHGGRGGPAASETSLDVASQLVGRGEDVSVHDQDVQPLGFLLMGDHVLQPQEASVVEAWPVVFQVGALPEAARVVGRSQEAACLVEEAQTPVMILQDWGQKVEGVHRRTADEDGQPERVGSGLPEVVQLLSHGVHP